PFLELLVELLGSHAEHLPDDFPRRLALGEGVHHLKQLAVAPAALDVIADASRLKIGYRNLGRVLGPDKATVELGDRKQFLIPKRNQDIRCDAVTPVRGSLCFLVHRQPLGEPAWHAVIGGGENEDMAHFVPECAGPMKLAGFASRRAIHGNDITKGGAERAETRHTRRAYGKVLVVRIDFHLNGPHEFHVVFVLISGKSAPQFRPKIRKQEGSRLLVKLQDRSFVLEGHEVRVTVQQAKTVYGDVISVAVVIAPLELLASL